jgi:hypothetical protein
MRKSLLLIAALCLITAYSRGDIAQGRKVTPTSVTTTIHGLGPDTVPTYRLQSDQLGSYKNAVDSVTSEIQATFGDWDLDTNTSLVRTVFLDFRDPVPGSNPNQLPPPFVYGLVHARLISRCSLAGGDLRTMSLGSTLLCPLSIAFDYAGNSYALRMNANYPGTEFGLWTCVATDASSKCNQWRLEPSAEHDLQSKNVAQLIRIVTVRGKTTNEDRGDYYLSFVVDVTNP